MVCNFNFYMKIGKKYVSLALVIIIAEPIFL